MIARTFHRSDPCRYRTIDSGFDLVKIVRPEQRCPIREYAWLRNVRRPSSKINRKRDARNAKRGRY